MRNDIRRKFITNTWLTIYWNKLLHERTMILVVIKTLQRNGIVLSMCLSNIEISFIDRMLAILFHHLKWFSSARNNKSSTIVCPNYSFWMYTTYLGFPIMLNKKQSFHILLRNIPKQKERIRLFYYIVGNPDLLPWHYLYYGSKCATICLPYM